MTIACLACGGQEFQRLPTLPDAMFSDGKCLGFPLAKVACCHCGLIRHADECVPTALAGLFEADYRLHAEPPNAFDQARAQAYAVWLQPWLNGRKGQLFEIGCGNGALLAALRNHHGDLRFAGIEPNPAAAALAAGQGFAVSTGLFGVDTPEPQPHDVLLSVNVIEHVPDPLVFLRAMHAWLKPGGQLLLICPDGEQAGTELLIADHLHTFSQHAIQRLLARAGWQVLTRSLAPPALAGFQLLVAECGERGPSLTSSDMSALNLARETFLLGWQRLDQRLLDAMPAGEIAVFGVGEFAMLLRCYAPRFWERVTCLTGDVAPANDMLERRWVPLSELRTSTPLFIATRPAVQASVIARLQQRGLRGIPVDPTIC